MCHEIQREKGRDLTQSYDKSPYTENVDFKPFLYLRALDMCSALVYMYSLCFAYVTFVLSCRRSG